MSDGIERIDWDVEEISIQAQSIVAGSKKVRPEDRLGYIKGRLSAFPKIIREAIEPLVLETERIVRKESSRSSGHLQTWEKILLFTFGAVFLVLLVIIALRVPNPLPFQKNVFCIALSLSAASIGAILPGLIHVEGKLWGLAVRAAGAIALGVFVSAMCLH